MTKFVILCWLGFAGLVSAQAVLEPPFGLKWGDSPGKLIELADKHRMDIRITLPGNNPQLRVVRITPQAGFIPSSEAKALEGRFLAGRLFEVSVHYGSPDQGAAQIDLLFQRIKRELTSEHGKFSPDQQDRQVRDRFSTSTQSFIRKPVEGLFLLLAQTEMEDLLRKSREVTFSLIYRNDNFRQQIQATLPPAGGEATGK